MRTLLASGVRALPRTGAKKGLILYPHDRPCDVFMGHPVSSFVLSPEWCLGGQERGPIRHKGKKKKKEKRRYVPLKHTMKGVTCEKSIGWRSLEKKGSGEVKSKTETN